MTDAMTPRLHLWTLASICLIFAIDAFVFERVTAGWSYPAAPVAAAVAAASLELDRSDANIAGSAIAAFVDTGILIILGLLVRLFVAPH